MTLTPRLRKFVLTTHITASVGWLGAVAGFLALAITGLASRDAQTVRAAYLAMELVGWFVIVPFSLVALLTGLVHSLGTEWGLFRHYWVMTKFLLTIISVLILFMYTQTLSTLGDLAADMTLSIDDLRNPSPVLHATGGLLVLIVAATLSVYKPWGLTRYGRRKQQEEQEMSPPNQPGRGSAAGRPWGLYALVGIIGLILLAIVLHVAGGGLRGH